MNNKSFLSSPISFLILIIYLNSCSILTKPLEPAKLVPASSIVNSSIYNYNYIYLTSTSSVTSSSGYMLEGQYYSTGKTVVPSDIITGILTKEGFIRLPEIKPELIDYTLIVNYGESGKRSTGLGGYTLEVTIQFVSAKSSSLVCSCTAEGRGTTEADDIRQAISRCLDELILFNEE